MAKGPDLHELELRTAILMTGLLQPVSVTQSGSKLSVLCRQVPGQEKAWLRLAHQLLLGQPEHLHLCRRYVLKDGQMVFGWHLGLEGKNAAQKKSLLKWLVEALATLPSPASSVEVAAPQTSSPTHQPNPRPVQDDPNFERDAEIRRERVRARTTAEPRTPFYDPSLRLPTPVEASVLRTVFRGSMAGSGNKTVPFIIEEMPLPHVNVPDMNVPNAKGRGATGVR